MSLAKMSTTRKPVTHWCYWSQQPDLRYACGISTTPSWDTPKTETPPILMQDDRGDTYAWNSTEKITCELCRKVIAIQTRVQESGKKRRN